MSIPLPAYLISGKQHKSRLIRGLETAELPFRVGAHRFWNLSAKPVESCLNCWASPQHWGPVHLWHETSAAAAVLLGCYPVAGLRPCTRVGGCTGAESIRMTGCCQGDANRLKQHLMKTFAASNEIRLSEKLGTFVRLVLRLPERAVVLRADEKSQIKALDRTQPWVADQKGPLRDNDSRPQTQPKGYFVCRHGCARRDCHQHIVAQVTACDPSAYAAGKHFT